MSKNLTKSAVATVLSGVLYYFGASLTPIPWLTWLAPIPILLITPRATWRTTALAAFLAYLLGSLNLFQYYVLVLRTPIPVVLVLLISAPLLTTCAVLLFRTLLVRGRWVLAALAFACTWTSAEYLVAAFGPSGSNWSLANTQADLLPVLQIASATGIWGVTFLLTLVPATIAALFAPGIRPADRLRVAATGAAVLTVALTYGFGQLAAPAGPTLRVTALAVRAAADQPHLSTPEGDGLLAADLAAIHAIPAGSTRIVVLPEKDLIADDATLPHLVTEFEATAKDRRFDIVLGLGVWTDGLRYNTALGFPADGDAPVVYHKQFPVPGTEPFITPGRTDAFLTDLTDRVGIAICADLGQPALGRRYAEQGARLMIVPALDFTVDAWSQSRVQLMRAVENGYAMVRPARLGYLLLADPHGRVLAQTQADTSAPVASITADLPLRAGTTLYTRWGDWFGYLSLLGTAVALLGLRRRPADQPTSTLAPDDHHRPRRQ
jgi:apolipoprotein N-acyltransferase